MNPYLPATMKRDEKHARDWQRGYDDAAAGKGLISANGKWLEGWHDYHANKTRSITNPNARDDQ